MVVAAGAAASGQAHNGDATDGKFDDVFAAGASLAGIDDGSTRSQGDANEKGSTTLSQCGTTSAPDDIHSGLHLVGGFGGATDLRGGDSVGPTYSGWRYGPLPHVAFYAASDGSSAASPSSTGREGGGIGGAAAQADAAPGKQEDDENERGANRRDRKHKLARPTKQEAGCAVGKSKPVKRPKRKLRQVAATITAAAAG